MKVFGQRIVSLRKEMQITQKELADAVHISQQALYRIEKGMNKTIPHDVLLGLTMKLECTEDYLYGLSDNPSLTRDLLKIPIKRYPSWMTEFKLDSSKLFMQDTELGRMMLKCSNLLSAEDMKTLKKVIKVFIEKAKKQECD